MKLCHLICFPLRHSIGHRNLRSQPWCWPCRKKDWYSKIRFFLSDVVIPQRQSPRSSGIQLKTNFSSIFTNWRRSGQRWLGFGNSSIDLHQDLDSSIQRAFQQIDHRKALSLRLWRGKLSETLRRRKPGFHFLPRIKSFVQVLHIA